MERYFCSVKNQISKYCADYDYYNYVELKAQYKNYIVTNKYVRNSDTYVLELMNPFSKKTKEVYVRDYLYYNTYFVGDTIKVVNIPEEDIELFRRNFTITNKTVKFIRNV